VDLARWMALMFARFVAVSVTLVSGWTFLLNLSDRAFTGWILTWVLASGLVGALGGVAYLLSLDGAERFRSRAWRIGGWVAMLAAVVLPTSLTFMLVPLVVLLVPSLFLRYRTSPSVTST
jgi:hypothetical protein